MKFLKKYIEVVKLVLYKPSALFEAIMQNNYSKEITILFTLSTLITVIKSINITSQKVNVFASESLNKIMTLLGNPQLNLLLTYLSYFLIISIIYKLFGKGSSHQLRHLMLCFMAISVIGIIVQVFFAMFKHVVSLKNLFVYFVYLWVVVLNVKAIKHNLKIPTYKATLSFIAVTIPFIFFVGVPVISPYLVWLNR